ncbi:hypothetical protein HK405_008548, partial [Cladochytrium tenue]
ADSTERGHIDALAAEVAPRDPHYLYAVMERESRRADTDCRFLWSNHPSYPYSAFRVWAERNKADVAVLVGLLQTVLNDCNATTMPQNLSFPRLLCPRFAMPVRPAVPPGLAATMAQSLPRKYFELPAGLMADLFKNAIDDFNSGLQEQQTTVEAGSSGGASGGPAGGGDASWALRLFKDEEASTSEVGDSARVPDMDDNETPAAANAPRFERYGWEVGYLDKTVEVLAKKHLRRSGAKSNRRRGRFGLRRQAPVAAPQPPRLAVCLRLFAFTETPLALLLPSLRVPLLAVFVAAAPPPSPPAFVVLLALRVPLSLTAAGPPVPNILPLAVAVAAGGFVALTVAFLFFAVIALTLPLAAAVALAAAGFCLGDSDRYAWWWCAGQRRRHRTARSLRCRRCARLPGT